MISQILRRIFVGGNQPSLSFETRPIAPLAQGRWKTEKDKRLEEKHGSMGLHFIEKENT